MAHFWNSEITLMLIYISCLNVPSYTIALNYIMNIYKKEIIHNCTIHTHPDEDRFLKGFFLIPSQDVSPHKLICKSL